MYLPMRSEPTKEMARMAGWSHTKSTAENNNNNNNDDNNNNNKESYLGYFLPNGYLATGTCGAFSAKRVATERRT